MKNILKITACLTMIQGCSIYEAAHAPTPIDYQQIKVGSARNEAIKILGFPKITQQKGENTVDTFEFTDGNSTASKSRIILYLAGDVFTAGLAELIFWPMESNLLDGKQCVGEVTYGADEKIIGYELKDKKGTPLWYSPTPALMQPPAIPQSQNNSNIRFVVVRNKFNPSATQVDYEKTVAKCKYEASKMALDNTQGYQERPVLLGTSSDSLLSLSNTLNQMSANQQNKNNAATQEEKRLLAIENAYEQCLEADGFVASYSSDRALFEKAKQDCPFITNSLQPCFMKGM